jgi:hypothetical protein
MSIFAKFGQLGMPVAIVIASLALGAEAHAQAQIDVVNGTAMPLRFQLIVPSPVNPSVAMPLPDRIMLMPNEVGHFQVPLRLVVPFSANPDGSVNALIGAQGFDPWTGGLLWQGGWQYGAAAVRCTVAPLAPSIGPAVTVFQIVAY